VYSSKTNGQWLYGGPEGSTALVGMETTQRLKVLHQNIQHVRAELAPMQHEVGNFRLDSYALRTGESHQRVPVYDYGYPLMTQ
jgi:hypothetical protein